MVAAVITALLPSTEVGACQRLRLSLGPQVFLRATSKSAGFTPLLLGWALRCFALDLVRPQALMHDRF
jgi:hypothetical protein